MKEVFRGIKDNKTIRKIGLVATGVISAATTIASSPGYHVAVESPHTKEMTIGGAIFSGALVISGLIGYFINKYQHPKK